jgi:DNA polymerase/3'-5' exonuclease PolX
MSTTDTKRPLAKALADAEAFRDLFSGYRRWEIAGSVRRGKAEVSDVEHVLIDSDLHHVWDQLDAMVGSDLFPGNGAVTKAVYPNGTHRWGPRYRGVMFRGFRHELFLADPDSWGPILAIRTGPASFSEKMVTALHRTPFRQANGYLTEASTSAIVPCRTEREFLQHCGMRWMEPKERVA